MTSKNLTSAAAGLCLFILAAQVMTAMRTKSPTCDEFSHHVASGYSYLVTGDFRMNPASPPLPRMLAALPLLFLRAKAPLDHDSWQKGDSPEFARQFFEVANHNQDQLIFWARFPIALLSVLFGYAVFRWARSLWGDGGGLASLFLYSFCPDILAHSGLATADLAVAFFFFVALVFFYRYLLKPLNGWLTACALFTGLALLSKFSAVLLFPIFFVAALASGEQKKVSWRPAAWFLGVCFLTVWAGYFFEVKPLLKNTPAPEKKIAEYQRLGGETLARFAQKVPVPLSTFSSALVSMVYTRAAGTNAYLMGKWSKEGWWHYYFTAFGIKNTIPFLILCLLSLLFLGKLGVSRTLGAVFLVPILFFFVLTLRDKAQAGIRYFLPIYPLFFVLAGGAAAFLWKRNKFLKFAVILLLSWHASEALRVFPHHLAYFNQFAGGPSNGYRYLRDSNVDWGQDLKGLGEYVRERGYPEVVILSLAPSDPAYYGIPARSFEKDEFRAPRKTVYAVGAHFMGTAPWTEGLAPDAEIGHSFFVYDLRK